MKRRLILESISSSTHDLQHWAPTHPEDVYLVLDLFISFSDGEAGGHYFYVTLATPEGLQKHREAPYLVTNRTLVISHYRYPLVEALVRDILTTCSRARWEESCACLQRYFYWEYEDYTST